MTTSGPLAEEHAALRRVATLVAEGASPERLFAAVAQALGVATVSLGRPGDQAGVPIVVDGSVRGVLVAAARDGPLPEDMEERLAEFSDLVAMAMSNAESSARLRGLVQEQAALRRVATMIAVGASRSELTDAVLREAAAVMDVPAGWLVHYEPDDTLTVLASLNDPTFPPGSRWPLDGESLSSRIRDTGRPSRVDDYSEMSGTLSTKTLESGIVSVAGAPIVVDGAVWGAICLGSPCAEDLPADTETRLRDFTELVSTAISDADARDELRGILDEQAALRRVATLVAQGAGSSEVYDAVCEEAGKLLGSASVNLSRFRDGQNLTVAGWSRNDPHVPVGTRFPITPDTVAGRMVETHAPVRIDSWVGRPSDLAELIRRRGIRSSVGAPVVVEGMLWGALVAGIDKDEALPAGTELRLARFTELIATAVSNAQARHSLRLLADEQASLRRVATLVARVAPPWEVFSAVAEEVGRLFGLIVEVARYGDDGTATVIGAAGDHPFSVGSRWPLDGPSIMQKVHETGEPARIDDFGELGGTVAAVARDAGFRAAIGAPIVVGGATWGVIIAIATGDEPVPDDADARLAEFTELVATAVSNLQANDDLRALAAQQAALRRVATLVAEGAAVDEIFAGVANEVAEVLGVRAVRLDRYDADGAATTLASSTDPDWPAIEEVVRTGGRRPRSPGEIATAVFDTGRSVRIDDDADAEVSSACAVPIVVDGKLWGAIAVFARTGTLLPAEMEGRLYAFTELVATAVSNAAARGELIASRARIVAAGDEARRRIERNLHDGTQQRLIALGLDLQRVRGSLGDADAAGAGIERIEADLESVLADVRELSRGLHPPLLSRGGLRPSLRALARRSPIPVELDLDLSERPPEAIEIAVYYVVSEALTNAIRYSQASEVWVTVRTDHSGGPFGMKLDGRRRGVALHATIADDGVGGAEPTAGSGLIGLGDRVDALGGRFELDSPPGAGTRISVELPLEPHSA